MLKYGGREGSAACRPKSRARHRQAACRPKAARGTAKPPKDTRSFNVFVLHGNFTCSSYTVIYYLQRGHQRKLFSLVPHYHVAHIDIDSRDALILINYCARQPGKARKKSYACKQVLQACISSYKYGKEADYWTTDHPFKFNTKRMKGKGL